MEAEALADGSEALRFPPCCCLELRALAVVQIWCCTVPGQPWGAPNLSQDLSPDVVSVGGESQPSASGSSTVSRVPRSGAAPSSKLPPSSAVRSRIEVNPT